MEQTETTGESNEPRRLVVKRHRATLEPVQQIARGRELDSVMSEIESVEKQAKADAQRHKGRVDELLSRVRELRSAIASGEEWQEVECYERPNERLGCVELVRVDDGTVLDKRPMTADERRPATLPNAAAEEPAKKNGRRRPRGGGEAWAADAAAAAAATTNEESERPEPDGDE